MFPKMIPEGAFGKAEPGEEPVLRRRFLVGVAVPVLGVAAPVLGVAAFGLACDDWLCKRKQYE